MAKGEINEDVLIDPEFETRVITWQDFVNQGVPVSYDVTINGKRKATATFCTIEVISRSSRKVLCRLKIYVKDVQSIEPVKPPIKQPVRDTKLKTEHIIKKDKKTQATEPIESIFTEQRVINRKPKKRQGSYNAS